MASDPRRCPWCDGMRQPRELAAWTFAVRCIGVAVILIALAGLRQQAWQGRCFRAHRFQYSADPRGWVTYIDGREFGLVDTRPGSNPNRIEVSR